MFQRRHARVATRKKFEERMWKRDETFYENVHKIITENGVSIDDEMLEYIIDDIPDDMLQIRCAFRFRNYGRALKSFREDNSDRGMFGVSKYDRIKSE